MLPGKFAIFVGGFPIESPGTFEFESRLENLTEKTTYQLSPNNKLSQFMELRRKLHVTSSVAAVEDCCPMPPSRQAEHRLASH